MAHDVRSRPSRLFSVRQIVGIIHEDHADEGGGPMDLSRTFLAGRVLIKVGDITKEDVDAVVNAANGTLMGGGGVDGAIHRAGGPAILAACKEIRRTQYPDGLPTGEAVITTAGKLSARHVIHTVGPVYGRGGKDKAALLAACYRNSLVLATDNRLRSIAFPAISTGVYGYPLNEAATVCSRAIEQFLSTDNSIKEVRLVFFAAGDAEMFLKHHAFTE
jgi:O-acetyl-ADP-ribose deacetylase (regulator of RNase III)